MIETREPSASLHGGDQGHPSGSSAALAVLRRWGWIIAVLAVAGGVSGWLARTALPAHYEANAAIVGTPDDASSFESLVPTLSRSDTVLNAVLRRVGMKISAAELASSGQLQFEPIRDGGGVLVHASAADPHAALDLANAGADGLGTLITGAGFGTFEVLRAEQTTTVKTGIATTVGLGIMAGALLGLLIVAALFLLLRPVLTAGRAARVADADLAFEIRPPVGTRAGQLIAGDDIASLWWTLDLASRGTGTPSGVISAPMRPRVARSVSALRSLEDLSGDGHPSMQWYEIQGAEDDPSSALVPRDSGSPWVIVVDANDRLRTVRSLRSAIPGTGARIVVVVR